MGAYSDFGLKARALMLQKKITMAQLAEKLGISAAYVSEILRGTRPGNSYKSKIANILGLDSEE